MIGLDRPSAVKPVFSILNVKTIQAITHAHTHEPRQSQSGYLKIKPEYSPCSPKSAVLC